MKVFPLLILLFFPVALRALAQDDNAPPPAETGGGPEVVITAGPDWIPFKYTLNIVPGSVFDFSGLNDAPAGKYGPIMVTPDGHLAFKDKPDQRARFWGVNVTFSSNFLPKAQADQLADALVRSGYNIVRIHHYDKEAFKDAGTSDELDPATVDRLDYFFSALKQRGIYANIDLFTIKPFSPEAWASFGVPKADQSGDTFKAVVMVSDAAYANFTRHVTNFLTHRNAYTGLTWAEDPALIGVCPVNEDVLVRGIERISYVKQLYNDAFKKWIADPKNTQPGEAGNVAFNRFLLQTTLTFDARNAALLKSLGSKALVTGSNWTGCEALTFAREKYDYVDNHGYWDHPKTGPKKPGTGYVLPAFYTQRDLIKSEAEMPRIAMPERIFGKPYSMTEFNYAWPNTTRSAGWVAMPAYACLQDWDAMYTFAYSSNGMSPLEETKSDMFNLTSDPIRMLGDRAAAMIFRRGNVLPAKGAICFAVDKKEALSGAAGKWRDFPRSFTFAGLISRIGSMTGTPGEVLASAAARQAGVTAVVTDGPAKGKGEYRADDNLLPQLLQNGVIPPGSFEAGGRKYVSDTGQISLDAMAGNMRLVTDRTECFVLQPGASETGTAVSVQNGKAFGSVYIVAVDNKPLQQSGRLLILNLTNSADTNEKFADSTYKTAEDYGILPHLLQSGVAQISVQVANPQKWQAWAVDPTGKRIQEVPLQTNGNHLVLKAGIDAPTGGSLAYELCDH